MNDLSDKFGGLDDSVISYLDNTERGQASMDGLSKSIANSSAEMGSATIKAELLSKAMNTLTNIAATLIIKFVAWGLDELIVTLDEQKEKLEESIIAYEDSEKELQNINDELKTTTERIDELNGKDNLTFTEQDELEKLIKTNEELERKLFLLEQVNKEAEKEVVTEAQKTYDKTINNRTMGAVDQIDFYTDSSLLEGVNWDNFKDDLPWLVAQYKKQEALLSEAQTEGWSNIEEQARNNLTLLEGYMAEASQEYQTLYDQIGGISEYSMTEDLKVAKQDLNDILDIVANILGYDGQRSETTFDDIWNSDEFSQYKTELETLAKEGKLDSNVLESNENYRKLLEDTGATAEDTAEHIRALCEEEEKTGEPKHNESEILSISDTIEQLNEQIKPAMDSLAEAYKNIFTKDGFTLDNVDVSMVEKIKSELDELSEFGISIDTKGYENFVKVLSDSTSTPEEVQKSFNEMATSILANFTDIADLDVASTMLKSLGVVNHEIIAFGRLINNTDALKQAGLDLANATDYEIQKFVEANVSAENYAQAVNLLKLQKILCNENWIDSTNDIKDMYALAKSAGIATDAISQLGSLKIGYDTAVKNGNTRAASEIYKQMQSIKAMVEAEFAEIGELNYNPQIVGTSGGGSSSAKKEYKEVFDFFERRIDILNNSLDLLKSNLENVNGSFAKNQLIDAQSSIYQEEIKNYTDALNMYQQKANEVLATLPDDIAEKIKNGSISLTTFMGESSEAVVDAMKDYEGWSDKIADCSQKLAELKETLRDLELEKFNNIIEDFTNQFDLRQTGINNIDKQIALFEESGMLIGKSFYQAQREQASKQLDILKEQQKAMANQLSSALSSGNIEAGTDEWIEMVSELQNVEGSILDCKKAIEEFDNAILDLHWQVFERIQDQFSNLDSELDNLIGLLDDIDVADTSGNWTTDSITKLGLLTQQYELAQYNVAEYNKAIEELKEQYANGEYSAIEYADKLAELSDGMWENANAVEAVKDAIMDLHEARVDKEIEGIEEEIEAYNELIQAKIDELDAEKELNDYRNSISQKSKSITDLERQIAAMSNDTTAATVAQRKKLEEQLAEAKKELEDAEYDHSIQSQKDALNKQYEDYEKTRNDEIEALRDSLNNQEKLIADSFETVKQNASTIGQQISNIAKQHGVQVSNSLTSSWQAGENAIASYGTVLSAQSSAFIGNIMGVENEVWALQNQADNTAVSLAYMFSTQADNLVNELAESYYAEGNLLNMTNALQSSLVNALERGYDISGITTALKGIENAANSAANALGKVNGLQANQKWYVVDSKTKEQLSQGFDSQEDAKKYLNTNASIFVRNGHTSPTLAKYAKGTRNSKGNLIVKDEQGYELVLPKLASGKYAIENEGSQILTKVETDNIFEWAKFNPDMFIPQLANNFATPISHIASKNVNNVAPSVNVGNLITVQGNVDSSNIKQMEIIANKAVNNLVDKMYNGKKYGSY